MTASHLLHVVARLFDVQINLYDGFGRLMQPPPEAILRVLKTLGAPVERMDDLAGALRQRRQFLMQRAIDPVIVAWEGAPLRTKLRLPSPFATAEAWYRIDLESGDSVEGQCQTDPRIKPVERCIEGVRYVTRVIVFREPLPFGYHRLHLEIGALVFDSYVLCASLQSYRAPNSNARPWGLFCPLYALASENSWGAGNFSDLETCIEFTGHRGGNFVGTLPLLSTFLDEPFNPSPYAPVSRLFWNEFYLDVARIPEFQRSQAARSMIRSSAFQAEIERLRAEFFIDYRPLMALKRRVIEKLLHTLMNRASKRKTAFQRFIETHPEAQDYAAFRAKVERERVPWELWPAAHRDGKLAAGDYDESARLYHLYVQWQAEEQLRNVAEKTKADGPALYLDFPLGVNRDGYDVWRERAVFALEASGGAPPDSFFTKGQNWGFPPLQPEALRQQGYRYYIACLRHHLQHAGMLRIDHVMGLHRLFWIPQGFGPSEGVYVHYPAHEFYAILSLESFRHQAQIVGENLGTVPRYVNQALASHKIHGMYVSQFCVTGDHQNALQQPAHDDVASLNTHDTPTFGGFWLGKDIEDRLALELLSAPEAEHVRQERASIREALIAYLKSRGWLTEELPEPLAVLRAWLSQLAGSDAYLLLLNLEDLWLEPLPQNVPGTWEERPNWKRRARFSLDEIRKMDTVTDILRAINEIRKQQR
ncbi:MAG TPA: 4-alpha-glucanotransferase [Candidatus Binatia bacterium]|jgi:4-alpha-glucanotransferase